MKTLIINLAKDIRDAFSFIRYFHKFKKVGKRCVMKKPMLLRNLRNVEFGDKVYILPGLRMETIERFGDQVFTPSIVFGNNVIIHQNVHIVSASSIIIHDNVNIGGGSMINDCTHGYADLTMPITEQPLTTKPIEIGENTNVGNNVLILPGVKIGRNCYIGGNTVIAKDVPDYSIVSAGKPRMVVMPHHEMEEES